MHWPHDHARGSVRPTREDSVGTLRVAVLNARLKDITSELRQDLERVIAPEAARVTVHVGVGGFMKCSESSSRLVVGLDGVISGEFLARLEILIEQVARLSSASGDATPDDLESEDW